MTYLNSEVFYRYLPPESCELVPLPPRAMAESVEKGVLDAGPLPIAEIHRLGNKVNSIGNLGVAANGPAQSVFLFSEIPPDELAGSRIGVTKHTATSVQLLRVLLNDLWNVKYYDLVELDESPDASLIIGDPALRELKTSTHKYVTDLGVAWNELTSLPFVFAEWVIRSEIDPKIRDEFESALAAATQTGIANFDQIATARANDMMSHSEVQTYVSNFVYELSEAERSGQREFADRLAQLPEWRPSAAEELAAK